MNVECCRRHVLRALQVYLFNGSEAVGVPCRGFDQAFGDEDQGPRGRAGAAEVEAPAGAAELQDEARNHHKPKF